MQYSPKLKTAMEEVKAILKKHDIAGFVVLHTPGFAEYVNYVSPSYSCAIVTENGMHFRLKQAEVGKERAKLLAEGTYNMVTLLCDMIAKHAMVYMEAQEFLKEKWGGTEFPGSETSHTDQNN